MNNESCSSDQSLEEILARLSGSAKLLVASDFDGTLATFVVNPDDVTIDPEARIALQKLSNLVHTFVCIISGRSLPDLRARFADLAAVRLIGSHGHEFDLDTVLNVTESDRELLQNAKRLMEAALVALPGSFVECKPHGVVFHYRASQSRIPAGDSVATVSALKARLLALGEGIMRDGDLALEFCAVHTNKGDALLRMREQLAPTQVLFIGDDVTDEDAFQVVKAPDVSIKVGQGKTAAHFRVATPHDAITFLTRLAERRAHLHP